MLMCNLRSATADTYPEYAPHMICLRFVLSLALLLCCLCVARSAAGQEPGSPAPEMATLLPPTPAEERLALFARKQELLKRSLVRNVAFRGIGPTIMSGRVVDLDVSPSDPTRFYVAYASGGVWRTANNGISFEPVFEHQPSLTIGDIAVDWDRGERIWVGTGENNSSRSSYAGTGIYRSDDGGATWAHVGLAETHRTGRIVLHPQDPNTVWVAAAGHLYSPNDERGIYVTRDGGESWTRTLFVNSNTGAIDLVIDPADPDVLYAAMWERARRAWNFVEAGSGSGIYKSENGGLTWVRLNTTESGFPSGEHVGRIGLAVYPGDSSIVYAFLDNQVRQPEDPEDQPALTKDMLQEMSTAEFLEVSADALGEYLERNGFPAAYTAQSILEMVREGKVAPIDLVNYLQDANQQLFDTPVVGAEVYRSNDSGLSWKRTHDEPIEDMYYSYGYYFGEIRVDGQNPEKIYMLGVPILTSDDGGATFRSINEENVHVDHHALWVNPSRPGHLVDGNDGGVNISYDDGKTWFKANTPPVGQFYAVQVDEAEPYRVYGGLQDNGVWTGPSTNEPDYEWYAEGDYPFDRILGGDGMQIEVDTRTNEVIYTGFQFGNYFRIDRESGKSTRIQPEHELGERPYRFNWMTPIHLSRHNQDILYLGSNVLHRSMNRGEDWEAISEDLTRGGRPGDVPYGTLTTVDESPLRFGLIYVGTDDGLVHVTRDGGATWTKISDALPQHLWVSRVEASHHHPARIYVAVNGYRWDNFTPYLYRSDDHGVTWQRLGEDLPMEPVNVVLEDPANADILYVGTDHGLYVTLDGGQTFMSIMGEMPFAPVHDLKVQSKAKELVVGTHGRSIFVADVEHVQQLTPSVLESPLFVFDVDSLRHDERWGERRNAWREVIEPTLQVPFFAGSDGEARLTVRTADGTPVATWTVDADRGLNFATYAATVVSGLVSGYEVFLSDTLEATDDGGYYLRPGTYTVRIELGAASQETSFKILPAGEERRRGVPRPSEEQETK